MLKASSALGRTVLRPEVTDVLDDFKRLTSEEAKARFADHFLGRTASVMDEIWPTFYELLKRVEEDGLYAKADYLVNGQAFGSFKEYFEHRVGRPYETFLELESTYHFAKDYAPDLLKKAFAIARTAKERAVRGSQALALAIKNGLTVNEGDGPRTEAERANCDNITVRVDTLGGTNAEYLMRRIARDRPDILDRACAGEFPSTRAAAIAAGIAPRTQSIRIDDPESTARTLRKHMPHEALLRLVELLTRDD